MKNKLLFVFLLITTISFGQTNIRNTLRLVYGGDTCDVYMSGDSVIINSPTQGTLKLNFDDVRLEELTVRDTTLLNFVLYHSIRNADYILFDTTASEPGDITGTLHWNDESKTLDLHNGNGSVTSLGREQNIFVQNLSGTSISNGQGVYIISSPLANIRIGRADKDDALTAYSCIGLATTNIPNGGFGRICTFGEVHGLNTNSFTEGAYVYLGDNGAITQTKPTTGHVIILGVCLRKHVSDGVIGVFRVQNSFTNIAILNRYGTDGVYIDSVGINTPRINSEDSIGLGGDYIHEWADVIDLSPSTGKDTILPDWNPSVLSILIADPDTLNGKGRLTYGALSSFSPTTSDSAGYADTAGYALNGSLPDSTFESITVGTGADTTLIKSNGLINIREGDSIIVGSKTLGYGYFPAIDYNVGGKKSHIIQTFEGLHINSDDFVYFTTTNSDDSLFIGNGRYYFKDSPLLETNSFLPFGVTWIPASGLWGMMYDADSGNVTYAADPASDTVDIEYRSVTTNDSLITQGKVEYENTFWDDLNFSPLSAAVGAAAPDNVTINNTLHKEFTSANNQSCGESRELPHPYKLSTTLTPHAHIFLKASESAGTTGVTFTFYWELRQTTGTTSGSVTLSATSAQLSGNGNKIDITGTAFAGAAELGSQLSVTIARTAGDAGDVVVSSFGVHYEVDAPGSALITTKF